MEDTKDKTIKPVEYPKKVQGQSTTTENPKVIEEVPVTQSPPSITPSVKKVESTKPVTLTYRLNLYKGNGQLRSEISKGVFYEMSRRHGDIIRVISNNKFHTLDEICDNVWAAERKNFNRGHDRTRKAIVEAVADLLETGCLISRTT